MIMWHDSRPKQVRQQGAEPPRSWGGKARSNECDLSHFRNAKIVWALRMDTSRAYHKAGPATDKCLDPVLVYIRGTTIMYLNLWRINILSISAEQLRTHPCNLKLEKVI